MNPFSAPLTGRKVLGIALGAFAVILTPNIILAYFAVNTFSGLIVPNSYIASQQFDDLRRAQVSLAWSLELDKRPGALHLAFTGADGRTIRPDELRVTVGRPTTDAHDSELALERTPTGYAAPLSLEPGNWLVLVDARAADGTEWSQRHSLYVRAPAPEP